MKDICKGKGKNKDSISKNTTKKDNKDINIPNEELLVSYIRYWLQEGNTRK